MYSTCRLSTPVPSYFIWKKENKSFKINGFRLYGCDTRAYFILLHRDLFIFVLNSERRASNVRKLHENCTKNGSIQLTHLPLSKWNQEIFLRQNVLFWYFWLKRYFLLILDTRVLEFYHINKYRRIPVFCITRGQFGWPVKTFRVMVRLSSMWHR